MMVWRISLVEGEENDLAMRMSKPGYYFVGSEDLCRSRRKTFYGW